MGPTTPPITPITKPIILLGEAWGKNEAQIGEAFVGPSGIELLKMLAEAGLLTLTSHDRDDLRRYWRTENPAHTNRVWLNHPEFVRLNVFNLHPPQNDLTILCGDKSAAVEGYPKHDKGWISRDFASHLDDLGNNLLSLDPNLIIAFGGTALWALTGTHTIKASRGRIRMSTHTVAGFKLLPVYHPAYILRNWSDRAITVLDLTKAHRHADHPDFTLPDRILWLEPTLADIRCFIDQFVAGCDLLSVDIETVGDRITCIGLAPSAELGIVIPFDAPGRKGKHYWPTLDDERDAWYLVRSVLVDARIPKLFQNGLYDIAFLARSVGIYTRNAAEDTMLLHHALQPELEKGLEFLGSAYTEESNWKREHRTGTIKRDA